MSDFSAQKIQLKIQQEIRHAEDEIVIAIQEALDESQYGDLEEAQFRNLVRVADTTESREVIKNFLRYQVGRDKKWGRGDKSLATRIIRDIDGSLQQKSEAIARATQPSQQKAIAMELIRRYLGYGARYLKFKNSKDEA